MFAQSVVGSWRFINMSRSARLLYYDIGMTADDEGVSEGLAVMRATEASPKDFEELASNGFIDFWTKAVLLCTLQTGLRIITCEPNV